MEMQVLSKPQFSANPVERDSAEALAFNDPTHVKLTLQVLGLMCDGQNRTLQVRIYKYTIAFISSSILRKHVDYKLLLNVNVIFRSLPTIVLPMHALWSLLAYWLLYKGR